MRESRKIDGLYTLTEDDLFMGRCISAKHEAQVSTVVEVAGEITYTWTITGGGDLVGFKSVPGNTTTGASVTIEGKAFGMATITVTAANENGSSGRVGKALGEWTAMLITIHYSLPLCITW